jgi:hypothetical protein
MMKIEHEDEFLHKKQELSRKLALEVTERTGLKPGEVLQIVDFQFELLQEVIGSGRLESLRLPFIGIFAPVEYKMKRISENAAFRRLKGESDPEPGG